MNVTDGADWVSKMDDGEGGGGGGYASYEEVGISYSPDCVGKLGKS